MGAIYLVVTAVAFVTAPRLGEEQWPLRHDQVGYYAYLPALLHEGGLSFEWAEGPRWDAFRAAGLEGFRRVDATGRLINSYTPGVAVLQAPLFLAAHVMATGLGVARDGFSAPYRFTASLGGGMYAALGLIALALALGLHFPQRVVIGVVVILGLGTNLFYYATFEPLMSHAYSFFALATALWATLAWGRRPSLRTALVLGGALGLAVDIRPTNLWFAVVPVTYALSRLSLNGARVTGTHVAAGAAAALVTVLPLFAYWKFAAGSWFTNPYGDGTFYFADPEIGRLLWSYRKGWFVYTPSMLALIPGLFFVHRYRPSLFAPLLIYFVGAVYVAASWWSWWYGGSMGMRAMIEVSAPMSVALAAFLLWSSEGVIRFRTTGAVFGLLVALNLFQTYQYVRNYIRWDGMSRESYWAVFLRPSIPPNELRAIYDSVSTDGQRGPGDGR